MIKHALTYEIMTPESVGVPGTSLVLGKHSGRHALSLRCEQLGFCLERRELDSVYRQFLVLADRQKSVEDRQIAELIAKERDSVRAVPMPPHSSAAVGVSHVHESVDSLFPQSYAAKGDSMDRLTASLGRGHEPEQQEDYLWGV